MSQPDHALFVRLLVKHQNDLLRYIAPLVGSLDDAQDVLQEAALALWNKFAQYDPQQPFLPWAKRFAKYEVLMHHRRRRRYTFLSEELLETLAELQQYNEVLRELARSRKFRLADVDRRVRQSGSASRLIGVYDIPTFEGFRVMAAGIVEAMGYGDLAMPDALELGLLPGVLAEWKSRLKPSADSLDSQRTLTLEPGQDWTTLKAPQQDELSERLPVPSQSFLWQDRVRGYVLHKNWGSANQVEAIAYVDSPTEREAFLNTGGNLKTVWLNGRVLYDRGRDWTGWHPGKERIPVRLQAGRNKIVVEAENLFFVSLTDEKDWRCLVQDPSWSRDRGGFSSSGDIRLI